MSWGTTASGAAAGAAAGAVAAQSAAIAMGMQTGGYNWNAIGSAAIGGALGAGLNSWDAFKGLNAVEQAASANALGQGASMALGLQKKFDWRGVAAAGMSAGVNQLVIGNSAPNSWDGAGRRALAGVVNGGVSAAIYDRRPDWSSIAANSFGSALGDAVVGAIQQADFERKHPVVSAEEKLRILDGFADGPGGKSGDFAHTVQAFIDYGLSQSEAEKRASAGEIMTDDGPKKLGLGGYEIKGSLELAANNTGQPLTLGSDGKLRTSDGRIVDVAKDRTVTVTDQDGRVVNSPNKARPKDGADAIQVDWNSQPKQNPLVPMLGDTAGNSVANLFTESKMIDLKCAANAKFSSDIFGNLEISGDVVNGGGVNIKGDSPLFKGDDTWILSRKQIDDGSYYTLIATSTSEPQKSVELRTMGNISSGILTTTFSKDGLVGYANPIDVPEAFPGTKSLTLDDVTDGMNDGLVKKAMKYAAEKINTPYFDIGSGRFLYNRSVNAGDVSASLACSFSAKDAAESNITMLLRLLGGSAREYIINNYRK